MFTNWYGQASCTAGRASFRPDAFRSARRFRSWWLSATRNGLKKETPTIAEFYKKNGYSTYYSRQVASRRQARVLSDRARLRRDASTSPPISRASILERHAKAAHPWFPKENTKFWKAYNEIGNFYEWEGVAGQPAKKLEYITVRQPAGMRHEADRFRARLYQATREGRANHSSWTSTSWRSTSRPNRRPCSKASRTLATIPTRCWSWTTTSVASWM